MNIRQALFSRLTSIGTQVFSDLVVYPEGGLPTDPPDHYITYRKLSNEHARHLGGGSEVTDVRYEVVCWATRALEADELAEKIRNNLDNVSGDFEGVTVQAFFLEDDINEFVPPTDSSHTGRHATVQDWRIWHVETLTPNIA